MLILFLKGKAAWHVEESPVLREGPDPIAHPQFHGLTIWLNTVEPQFPHPLNRGEIVRLS